MSFTGIKDLDREILKHIPEEKLLKISRVNKKTYNETCDDKFLERRVSKYPNIEKYKREETWKRFFCRFTYYKCKMEKEFRFYYTSGNFYHQYEMLMNFKGDDLLTKAASEGEVSLVKYIINKGKHAPILYSSALRIAAENGHIEIVKYATSCGADIHSIDDYALRRASLYGHFEIVKYLIEQGADIHARNDLSFRWACEAGHLEMAKYLYKQGCNIRSANDTAIILATENGHLHVVKWQVENGANIRAENNYVLRTAAENEHTEIVNYLESL